MRRRIGRRRLGHVWTTDNGETLCRYEFADVAGHSERKSSNGGVYGTRSADRWLGMPALGQFLS